MTPSFVTSDRGPDDASALRRAQHALELQRWSEARELLHQLATRRPSFTQCRALLAYARGQEALQAGDEESARAEWRRALTLDPSLVDAQRALAARPRRRSWVDRLLGRA